MSQHLTEREVLDWIELYRAGGQLPPDVQEQLLAMALLSLVWTPYDPTLVVAGQRLQGPSAEHWLGTDAMGIDVFSRILVGAQTTIVVGVVSVGIAGLLGVPLGILAGQGPRWLDEIVMRLTDIAYAFLDPRITLS